MASVATNEQMVMWEHKYHDITQLYRLNDELIATVETAADPEAQYAMIESLVEVIGESTDVLTDEYIALCEGNPSRKKSAKATVEGALRKMYSAIHEFTSKAKAKDMRNQAYLVVKKIKRQLEQVIENFVEMVAISLDRIMQKHDVEDLKARHANIALLLYSSQKGQGN